MVLIELEKMDKENRLSGYLSIACVLCFIFILPLSHYHTVVLSNVVKILTNHFDPRTSSQTSQILPTKMSYSANLKNVMSMENGQRSSGSQPLAEQELEASKPGPSPHDLAAQLKSSLLAEIGLTESDGPPLPSFR